MLHGKVDLHFHTECSGDSYMPLFAVAPMARRLGLRAIAKADHDSVAGCEELARCAAESGVEYIPAVELSSVDDGGHTWHILGYFVDLRHPDLLQSCEREKAFGRLKLREQMKAWIAAGGPALSDLEAFLAGVASLRPAGEISIKQVLDHLVGGGFFENVAGARADFDTRAANWQPPVHAAPHWRAIIDLVHSAAGVAVVAHPRDRDLQAVRQMLAAGADGIECHNVKVQDAGLQSFWRDFCARHDLAWTGGTDWHGPVEHWNVHDRTVAGYDAVESLKKAYARRFGRNP